LPARPSLTVRRRFQFANSFVRRFTVHARPGFGSDASGLFTLAGVGGFKPASPERPNFAFCAAVCRHFAFSIPARKNTDKSPVRGLNRPAGAFVWTLFGRCPARLKTPAPNTSKA